MTPGRIAQLARLAGGFRGFLRSPLTREAAIGVVRRQMEGREARFLSLANRLVYGHASSPYRALLLWAGCGPGDLEAGVRRDGLDRTLERLCDAGVRLSLDEFKSRTPIRRPGLTLETSEADFDNPAPGARRVEGVTSGSRGRSTRVTYDWEFIAEESAHELLLYDAHGVLDAPLALWYPVPPGIAGIHNLLMQLKLGHAPDAWFSHTPPGRMPLEGRLAMAMIRMLSRSPRPEFADLASAVRVAGWLDAARAGGTPGVLRTYCSSAVRVAEVALAGGSDLRGSVIFSGGEPLTEERRRFIESTGARVFPRYVITESGVVAAACPHRSSVDDMHVYTDRLAVIEVEGALHYTSLTAHAGKILFNTELGDRGELATRACPCVLGELGLDCHLAHVRSNEKVTVEGVTMAVADVHAAVAAAMVAAGGSPDACQLRQVGDDRGLARLVITVSPEVEPFDESAFIDAVLGRLSRATPAGALASEIWRQAATLQVVRERPRASSGHKLLVVGPRGPDASH